VAIESPRPAGSNTYEYTDVSGEPLFRVVRGRNKQFYQQRWDGERYVKGLGDATRVLYNLPNVIETAMRGGTIWIVEGEKDADILIQQGITATCNPGGAGKWRPEYAEAIRGAARVNIVWDDDDPDPKTGKLAGQQHALEVEQSLLHIGARIRMLRAVEGNDLADHVGAGHAISDLVRERPGDPLPQVEEGRTEPYEALHEPAVYQLAYMKLVEHARNNGLKLPTQTDKGWEACCPAHDDHRQSLGIMVGDEQPLVVNCQAGCTVEEIARELHIDLKEFFQPAPSQYDAQLEKEVQRQRVQAEARTIIASEAVRAVEFPPDPYTYLTAEDEEVVYSVERLHIQGGNTLIVAQYKTGKTSLSLNLYRSLVNCEPFLGKFEVREQEGRVAYFDYEMMETQFKNWLKAGGELDEERMATPWHLRGTILPIWIDSVRVQVVDWFKRNDVSTWIVDPATRAWSGLVENENSNSEILRFTDSLDQIKAEAGITDFYLIAHMGRQAPFTPVGQERARGATRLEDWMDVGWYLTKDDKNTRYMRAQGRGVDMEPITLNYSSADHALTTSGISRREHDERTSDQKIVDILASIDHVPTTSQLKDMLGGKTEDQGRKILDAENRGLIKRSPRGRSMMVELTDAGRNLQSRHRRARKHVKSEEVL